MDEGYNDWMNWNEAKILAGRVSRAAFLFAIVITYLTLSVAAAADLSYLKMRAEQGDAFYQHYLGERYRFGYGVTKDYLKALYWYKKAAEQGDEYAQRSLGFMYYEGRGVTKNLLQAAYWWKRAAEQGDESATRMLEYLNSFYGISY